jgi:hypothetical protein
MGDIQMLHHLIEGSHVSVDFGIFRESGTSALHIPRTVQQNTNGQ